MVSVRDGANRIPLSPSPFSATSSAVRSSSSTSTTQVVNILTSPKSPSSHELPNVQLYHDLLKFKKTNMATVKDVNILRDNHASSGEGVTDYPTDIWKSYNERRLSARLIHQDNIKESSFYTEPSVDKPQNIDHDKNINIEHKKVLYSSESRDDTIHEIQEKRPNVEIQQINNSKDFDNARTNHRRSERARKWWNGRVTSKTTSNNQTTASSNSSLTGTIRRTRFWNSLSKTLEIPDRLRKDDKKFQKVPKLQIWLSTDSRGAEPSTSIGTSVLNNTRENVPRIQLQKANVLNKGVEVAKWRALSEGSAPPGLKCQNDISNACTSSINNTSSTLKSPVGKQPTWPVCHMLQPRPKLIHQNCLNINSGWSQESQSGRRLELPRQNAVWEETENKEAEMIKRISVKNEDDTLWKNRGSVSVESPNTNNPSLSLNLRESKASLCKKISAPVGHMSLGLNLLFGRRNRPSSRSYSDEKSEAYDATEEFSPVKSPSFNSVFSLSDPPSTPTFSWASSHASLRSEFVSSSQTDQQFDIQRERSPSFNPDYLSPSQQPCHPPCTRSNSATSTSIFSFGDKSPFRLTVPGSEGSRRPSLLSLRSLTRSPIPYVSMDYDYDSEYEMLYNLHSELVPEAAPKLSFTQKLAFPTLHQNSIDRPKPRDPYTEADNSMNTVAKIITIVILTFVIVFVLGGLYKLVS